MIITVLDFNAVLDFTRGLLYCSFQHMLQSILFSHPARYRSLYEELIPVCQKFPSLADSQLGFIMNLAPR